MDDTLKKLSLEFCGKGMHKIKAEQLFKEKDVILLDVRTMPESHAIKFNLSHFGITVINIPLDKLPEQWGTLPKDKLIVTFCSGGTRAAFAYVYLLSKGFEKIRWFEGGYAELAASMGPGKFIK